MALNPDAVVESLTEATAMEDFPVFVADAQSLQLIIEPRIDQFSTNDLEITEQNLSSSDFSSHSRFIIWASPGQDIWEAYSLGEEQEDSLIRAAGIIDSQAELLGWSRFLRLPEIQSVSFMYFDGEDWTEEWNSAESETLPKAIKVTVEIATSQSSDEETQLKTAIYTRTILIPGARFSAVVEDAE